MIARAVDWRDGGAINGIGVVRDLAFDYAPHEILFLALTGVPPGRAEGRAFGVALTWICAAHIGTSPTHAAILAQISGAPVPNLLAVAAVAAGQEAQRVLDDHAPLLARLRADLPPVIADGPAGERPRVDWRANLREASTLDLPGLDTVDDSSTCAALVVFHHLGVCNDREFVSIWVWARLLGVTAELMAEPALDVRSYPLRTPSFEYVE